MKKILLFLFLISAPLCRAQIIPPETAFVLDTLYGVVLKLTITDIAMYAVTGKDSIPVEKIPVLDAYPTEAYCIRRRTQVGPDRTMLTVETRFFKLRNDEEIMLDDVLLFKIRPVSRK